MAYGGGTFAAVSTSYSTVAASSTDGITWTQRTLPSGQMWNSIAYGNGTFVAVTNYGSNAAASSTDGITWAQRTLPLNATWNSVAYGNGIFVTAAQGNTAAATSTDGITWTQRTLPMSAGWYGIGYGLSNLVPSVDALAVATPIAANDTHTIKAGYTLEAGRTLYLETTGAVTMSTFGMVL
jgi:hypothetical protein